MTTPDAPGSPQIFPATNHKRGQELLSLPLRGAPRKSVHKRGAWRAEPSHADVIHRWTERLIGPSLDRRVLFARSEFPPPRNGQKQRTPSIVALRGFIVGYNFEWRPDDDRCYWECCVPLDHEIKRFIGCLWVTAFHPHVRSRPLSRRNIFFRQTQRLIGTKMSNDFIIH